MLQSPDKPSRSLSKACTVWIFPQGPDDLSDQCLHAIPAGTDARRSGGFACGVHIHGPQMGIALVGIRPHAWTRLPPPQGFDLLPGHLEDSQEGGRITQV